MKMIDQTQDRQALYWRLSQCYHPPDECLLATLRGPEGQGLLAPRCPDLEDLRRDHAQLFVGPFTVTAPPYASVYLDNDRRVWGETTMDVAARYREEGLKVTLKEPADHVAIELEYMSLLIHRQMKAEADGAYDIAAGYLGKQRDFLEMHLGVWIPMLTDRIVRHARTAFYRDLGRDTHDLVSRDLENCCSRDCTPSRA